MLCSQEAEYSQLHIVADHSPLLWLRLLAAMLLQSGDAHAYRQKPGTILYLHIITDQSQQVWSRLRILGAYPCNNQVMTTS